MARPVFLLISMFLVSCAMGPDFEQPQTASPDAFRMAASDGEAKSITNLPWWELLQDEELQQLIRIALKENRDLRRAVASIDEFRARALIAKLDFAPQLDATVSTPALGRKSTVAFPGFPSPFSYYTQGNLFWEIDVWGRIRRLNEAAWDDLLAREWSRRAVVLQLVSGVAEGYFDLLQCVWIWKSVPIRFTTWGRVIS